VPLKKIKNSVQSTTKRREGEREKRRRVSVCYCEVTQCSSRRFSAGRVGLARVPYKPEHPVQSHARLNLITLFL
jgi:hypothetical protein